MFIPIFRGEYEKRALFGHGFGFFCAAYGRTGGDGLGTASAASGLLLVILVLAGNGVALVTVIST